jgi:hypothetical protein
MLLKEGTQMGDANIQPRLWLAVTHKAAVVHPTKAVQY